VRRLPDGVILRHRTTDDTVRRPFQFHYSMDGLLPVLVMENILVVASCSNHHGRPLLLHPFPLPSDDGTVQQSTNNQPYFSWN
jgi:hypothetical protein